MTNPTPRPALRKAEDSGVHPAAPRPARTPRAPRTSRASSAASAQPTSPAPVAAESPAAEPLSVEKPAKRGARRTPRKFSGATSDHLRQPAEKTPKPTKAKGGKQDGGSKAAVKVDADLMTGKLVELDVRVPKKLRKAANAEAKRRGLDLDAVTTELLHRWLTGR